uniref:Uncharacterized protein n=1 Tax=Setaria digitata TaxID=48799 RepID=A0A915Q356_9BILA
MISKQREFQANNNYNFIETCKTYNNDNEYDNMDLTKASMLLSLTTSLSSSSSTSTSTTLKSDENDFNPEVFEKLSVYHNSMATTPTRLIMKQESTINTTNAGYDSSGQTSVEPLSRQPRTYRFNFRIIIYNELIKLKHVRLTSQLWK